MNYLIGFLWLAYGLYAFGFSQNELGFWGSIVCANIAFALGRILQEIEDKKCQ